MVERTPDNSEPTKKPAEEGKKIELITQIKQIPTDSVKLLEELDQHDEAAEEDGDEETKDAANLEK